MNPPIIGFPPGFALTVLLEGLFKEV